MLASLSSGTLRNNSTSACIVNTSATLRNTARITFYSGCLLPKVGCFQRPDISNSTLQSHQGYSKRLMLFIIVTIKLSKLSQNADGNEREGRLQTGLTQSPERHVTKGTAEGDRKPAAVNMDLCGQTPTWLACH